MKVKCLAKALALQIQKDQNKINKNLDTDSNMNNFLHQIIPPDIFGLGLHHPNAQQHGLYLDYA